MFRLRPGLTLQQAPQRPAVARRARCGAAGAASIRTDYLDLVRSRSIRGACSGAPPGDNGGFLGGVRQRWGTTGGTETLGCSSCVALEYSSYVLFIAWRRVALY